MLNKSWAKSFAPFAVITPLSLDTTASGRYDVVDSCHGLCRCTAGDKGAEDTQGSTDSVLIYCLSARGSRPHLPLPLHCGSVTGTHPKAPNHCCILPINIGSTPCNGVHQQALVTAMFNVVRQCQSSFKCDMKSCIHGLSKSRLNSIGCVYLQGERVFFPSKAKLPSETPDPIKALRDTELSKLRVSALLKCDARLP